MSVDLELAKILDEFSVPEAFRTKLVDSACLKVWQFAEYVDDVKDWTGILSSLEPPIVDRMHIASVRRAYKAACARDAELLSRGRDYPGEDMDAPIESSRRRTLIEEHARHYRFQLQLQRGARGKLSHTFLWTLLQTWPQQISLVPKCGQPLVWCNWQSSIYVPAWVELLRLGAEGGCLTFDDAFDKAFIEKQAFFTVR